MSKNLIRVKDLVTNPTPRIPICLCLDTSSSMDLVTNDDWVGTGQFVYEDGQRVEIVENGITRLDELKEGVKLFYEELCADEIAKFSAEICVVTFDDAATCVMDFANLERQGGIPDIEANGNTCMGEGVNMALDLLEQRKKEYRDKGVDYYQPWLVLMTDGTPNGSETALECAIDRTRAAVNQRKLTVFPIGVSKDADMDMLGRFSPNRKAIRLKGMRFREFFRWLSQSVVRVSQSIPGERVELDFDGLGGWGSL